VVGPFRLRGAKPRSIVIAAVAAALVVSAVVGFLAWRLAQQDRALAQQRVEEQLGVAADAIAKSYARTLSALDTDLDAFLTQPDNGVDRSPLARAVLDDPDSVLVRAQNGRVSFHPRERLLFSPVDTAAEPADSSSPRFERGERLEFQEKNYAAAIKEFQSIAAGNAGDVRAAALVRQARSEVKAAKIEAALATYRALEQLADSSVDGRPAVLLARHKICDLLETAKRPDDLRVAAAAFDPALYSGRWLVSRSLFEVYAADAARWLAGQAPAPPDADRIAARAVLSDVVGRLLTGRAGVRTESRQGGRENVRVGDRSALVVWREQAGDFAAVVTRAEWLEAHGSADIAAALGRAGASLVLLDQAGHLVAGRATPGPRPIVTRGAAETGLPWTIRVVGADPSASAGEQRTRHFILIAAVLAIAAVLVGGSYAVARAVTREMEVSRLQSEFVATVSHEFRTPLASIRHVSDLLAENRVPDEERRARYYKALQSESERLQRLVETLLDFRRMEEGARRYRLEPCDLTALLESVASRFRVEASRRGYELVWAAPEGLPRVRADADALTLAIWNLLDNAVKYSPACKTVWLEAGIEGATVAIRVRDRGLGIAPGEAARVFDTFTRGASAAQSGAGGTGLGLSIVRHIVDAHGGSVTVQSEPGAGSTFTLRLPLAPPQP